MNMQMGGNAFNAEEADTTTTADDAAQEAATEDQAEVTTDATEESA